MKPSTSVCGRVVVGEDDDKLGEEAHEHMCADQPRIPSARFSREDILAQAEDTYALVVV